MTLTARVLLAAAAVLAMGQAPPPEPAPREDPPAKRQCFFPRNVNGFSAVDDDVVNVRVGVRDIYQLKLLGPCPDVDWTWKIGIISRGSTICTGLDATLLVPSTIGPQRCAVRTVRKLTPEEVEALPPKQKP
jgi:hypothetical protein